MSLYVSGNAYYTWDSRVNQIFHHYAVNQRVTPLANEALPGKNYAFHIPTNPISAHLPPPSEALLYIKKVDGKGKKTETIHQYVD
jgi:hypothetical protein